MQSGKNSFDRHFWGDWQPERTTMKLRFCCKSHTIYRTLPSIRTRNRSKYRSPCQLRWSPCRSGPICPKIREVIARFVFVGNGENCLGVLSGGVDPESERMQEVAGTYPGVLRRNGSPAPVPTARTIEHPAVTRLRGVRKCIVAGDVHDGPPSGQRELDRHDSVAAQH